jgi:hypothetical protein
VLMAAFRLRRLLDSMASMMRPGAGSLLVGGMARRGAVSAMRRIIGAVGARGATPSVPERSRSRTASQEGADTQRVASVRVFRQAPGHGSPGMQPAGDLAGGQRRQALLAGGSLDGRSSSAMQKGGAAERSRLAHAPSARTLGGLRQREQDGKRESRQALSVNAAGVATPLLTTNPGSAGLSRSTAKSGSESARGRHSRTVPVEAAGSRYESRTYTHSASLRDGPPKGPRERRRLPATKQRKFREYSSVTKDGVTVLVPSRGRR